MDHPLLAEEQRELRGRILNFLSGAYKISRSSNIVFVCGGNDDTHMRMMFRKYCKTNLPNFEIFLPESAMENVLSVEAREPFDIVDFETLVGQLSHAIVVFPEAPGSFAETGYFSAVEELAEKCILVLDFNKQREDSFISLGPAKKISKTSVYQPTIQLDYTNPDFNVVTQRIQRITTGKKLKWLEVSSFESLSTYEKSAIIYEVANLCTVATFSDILYILRGIFRNKLSVSAVQKLTSILIGSGYLEEVSDYGHLTINPEKSRLLEVRENFMDEFRVIRLELLDLYDRTEGEFQSLVQRVSHVN